MAHVTSPCLAPTADIARKSWHFPTDPMRGSLYQLGGIAMGDKSCVSFWTQTDPEVQDSWPILSSLYRLGQHATSLWKLHMGVSVSLWWMASQWLWLQKPLASWCWSLSLRERVVLWEHRFWPGLGEYEISKVALGWSQKPLVRGQKVFGASILQLSQG